MILIPDNILTEPDAILLKGSRLGLSIVRDTVDRMGGEIKVKSDRGAGAEFSIWLPRKLGAHESR